VCAYDPPVPHELTPLSADTSPSAAGLQAEVLRRMGPAQRLLVALRMSDDARALTEAGIRHRHPEYTDDEVHQAMLAAMLGPELAERVRDAR
jgi:hypothetical protein